MRLLASCVTATFLLIPSLALGTPADCEEGSWTCEDAAAPAASEAAPASEGPAVDEPASTNAPASVDEGDSASTIPPPPTTEKAKPAAPPEAKTKAAPKTRDAERHALEATIPPPPKSEWGINMNVEGVLMGKGKAEDAGMGGVGAALRYRPVPAFAFSAGLDFLGGTDFHGDRRKETALMLSGLLFFNPKDVAQVYALGGLGFSWARVDKNGDDDVTDLSDAKYRYFGMHLGLGLEFRLTESLAFNTDIIGFIRGRTDPAARTNYEFIDPKTGSGTNTSGGGLLRAGLSFYW